MKQPPITRFRMAVRHYIRLNITAETLFEGRGLRAGNSHLWAETGRKTDAAPARGYTATMKFCSHCGSDTINFAIPEGDDRPRHVCGGCGAIHYINPRVIVGVVPYLGEHILLCKRAIEPRRGLWTLPAGFMENGETSEEGALRESWEEARTNVRVDDLYTVYDIPHINQVYLMYRGELTDSGFGPGPESLEVELFREDEIPWGEIAFPIVRRTLGHYFEDVKKGSFPLRRGVIQRKL